MQWRVRQSPGGDQSPVSTFAALLLVAFVAAGCVLWFMTVAMRNERLAVQQRLSDVYLTHLAAVQRQLTTFWKERQAALQAIAGDSAAEVFAATVRSNLADSVIIYDASGGVAYPSALPANVASQADEPKGWDAARELEFQKTNYIAAAEAYGRLAESNPDAHLKARALQAQGSCLLKAGQKDSALRVLADLTRDSALRNAVSPQGALLIPNVQLLMLKVIQAPSGVLFQQIFADLTPRLNDYREPEFSASQRRFLMEELARFVPEVEFPTLPAEHLAAEFLELNLTGQSEPRLQRIPKPKLWRLASPDRRRVALFREAGLREMMSPMITSLSLPGVSVLLSPPGEATPSKPLPAQEAGEMLPGWRLGMQFQGVDPFLAASERQTRFYLWTGFIGVLIIATLAFLAARFVAAQMRLARLKNELVSTVSHELKTPLASMRVLVDTLLAGRYHGSEQLESYLRLVAKENHRLSHLIENFLSFSRMEQGNQKVHFEEAKIETIVSDAVDAVRDRFAIHYWKGDPRQGKPALNDPEPESEAEIPARSVGSSLSPARTGKGQGSAGEAHAASKGAGTLPNVANSRLEVCIAQDLPPLHADAEALTTVLINLLDNAHKYTEKNKRVQMRAYRNNGAICFEVEDNGIGLTAREAAKVFDRFYQVDQSLSRKRGGCGLGLSIVQFIVKAHGGTVSVKSEPGQGSTFTVRLPTHSERRGG